MNLIENISNFINKLFGKVCVLVLLLMVFLIVSNIFMKMFFISYHGIIEIQGWLSALLISLALGYTQLYKGHVAIQIFVDRIKPATSNLIEVIINLISLAFLILVTWQIFRYAGHQRMIGSVSETLRWLIYPYIYIVAIGFAGLTLQLLVEFLLSFIRVIKKEHAESLRA
ncbi:MAG: TRAP transporter small permease [Bacillota bacterium]